MNESMREAAHYLLTNWHALPHSDWTVQGFGFLRLRISPSLRLHVWNSQLRIPGVSDIHDHAQWDFDSTVMSGQIVNLRYDIEAGGIPHQMATILCGEGGGMESPAPEAVGLKPYEPELYTRGQSYSQKAAEIHRTMPADGTVTLIRQQRADVKTARVFWSQGSEWVDAIPRTASQQEIRPVVQHALKVWE